MSKLIDPLLLLRDYYSNGKQINYLADEHQLVFGNAKIPVDSKTAWIKKVNNSQYTIGTLWFFLQNKDMPIRDYMIEADHSSFEKIHLLDKNKIIDYFTGKSDVVEDIDKTLIQETMIQVGKSKRQSENTIKGESDHSRPIGLAEKRDDKAKRKDEEEKSGIHKSVDQTRMDIVDSNKEREIKMMEFLMQNEKKIVSK